MDVKQLAEIKSVNESRAPGKWDYYIEYEELKYVLTAEGVELGRVEAYSNNPAANAFFITHATKYIPALLAEVERLQSIESVANDLLNELDENPDIGPLPKGVDGWVEELRKLL
jgi:hypothetical protein